jgi:hypothetical protein
MTEEYGRVEERKMEGKSTELEKNWDCGFSGYSLVPTRVFEVYKSMTCMKSFDDGNHLWIQEPGDYKRLELYSLGLWLAVQECSLQEQICPKPESRS